MTPRRQAWPSTGRSRFAEVVKALHGEIQHMDRAPLSDMLRAAIVHVLRDYRRQNPTETPYAFALIMGQAGAPIYAVATEQGLRRTASKYHELGYRYRGNDGEEFDPRQKLAAWLRWANPDDGWDYGEFPGQFPIQPLLGPLLEGDEFGQDAEGLEEYFTDVLATLRGTSELDSLTVGVTYGADPRDFVRTATKANTDDTVRRLLSEVSLANEVESRIKSPGQGT
ncbi:DUF4303 domain-containing protein [Isosphaeraceae bacterium EP7]